MDLYLFGYGSLINLESASKTLKRALTSKDVMQANLTSFRREWTLWDYTYSDILRKTVKGVFLNLSPSSDASLNGVLFKVSIAEMREFEVRERNYTCMDVTDSIDTGEYIPDQQYRVMTFVGKQEYLTGPGAEDYFIFVKYMDIINKGLNDSGESFSTIYHLTTRVADFPELRGDYHFVT